VLDLTGNEIRDCGAGVLSQVLSPAVRELRLQGTSIGARGYVLLSERAHVEAVNGIRFSGFSGAAVGLLEREPV